MNVKRFISIMLAFVMVLGMMPIGEMVVFAEPGDVEVYKIRIFKEHQTLEDLGSLRILVTGKNLEKLEVRIMGKDNKLKTIPKESASSSGVAQYSIEASEVGGEIYINSVEYSLQENTIPVITAKNPSNGIIDINKEIKLSGSNIGILKEKEEISPGVNEYKVKSYFTEGNNPIDVNPEEDIETTTGSAIINKKWGSQIGNYDLVFERNYKKGVVDIEIRHTYTKIMRVRGELDVSAKIDMFPTQGPRGSEVRLEADKLIGGVSVFLLEEKTDEYKQANMATNVSYSPGATGEKHTIKFEIPKSIAGLGPKYVVLTNQVDPKKGDINSQVNKYKIIEIEKDGNTETNFFTVTDGNNRMKIDSILPNESSTQGINAVLKGENIIRVSKNLYKEGSLTPDKIDVTTNREKMIVTHTGGFYDGKAVKTLNKEIEVIIGNKATFRSGADYGGTFDKLEIVVPEIEDIEESIKKDVYIQAKTSIVFQADTPGGVERKIDFIESDKIENGFTFHPKKFQPEIDKKKVTPEVIIVKPGADGKYVVVDDMIVSIEGKNFLKFGYGDKKVKNPVVSIDSDEMEDDGSPLDTSKWFKNAEIKVLKSGVSIDGEKTRQIGDQIKVTIKKDSVIPAALVSDNATVASNIRLTNPLRVESEDVDMGPSDIAEIYFKIENSTQKPVIRRVTPSIVNNMGKEILIIGENFSKTGLKVFLDGDEIERVNRISDTEIKFVAPPKEKGTYIIRVQNKEGEVVFHKEFIYVETITDPKIIDFNPKMGTKDTKVYLKGKSLKQPSTSVINVSDKIEVLGFIGTTVKLRKSGTNEEFIDMNDYNKNKALLAYTSNADDLVIEVDNDSKKLLPSKYYHSVIFEDKNTANKGDYYRIHQDVKTGDIVLEGGLGANNEVKNIYKLYYADGLPANEGKASKVGGASGIEFKVNTDSIVIDGLTLEMKTPYKIDSAKNKIIGNKVKVVDGETLEFDVNLSLDTDIQNGTYDVLIMNPDTSTADAQGKFKYVADPESNPTISNIAYTEEGSIYGKYKRTIEGTDFREGVTVYIGEKEIRKEDIEYVSKTEINVIIPPYSGNIELETEHGRKSVVVTVLNPDGGTGSSNFIYVNPNSKPIIHSIATDFGPVSGGTEVTLYEEKEFRFFESYKGDEAPEGHIDLRNKETRDSLGGNERDKAIASEDGAKKWKKQTDILPKIWFGDKPADILRYDTDGKNSTGKRTITVKVPKGIDGTTPVYLENNDFGVSNTINFKYTMIKIGTIEIKPGTGNKKGNNAAEIRSSEKDKVGTFMPSIINKFKYDENGIGIEQKSLQLVRFGNKDDLQMTNISIDGNMNRVVEDSSGRIVNNHSKVKLGNLTMDYERKSDDTEVLKFTLTESEYDEENKELVKVDYEFTANFPEGENEIYLPINLLKNEKGNYNGFELVKISKGRFTIDGKLSTIDKIIVERGYSEEAFAKQNGEYIELKTPSYYSVGEVDVKVINADGSDASTKYIYTNPANSPTITDIFREGNPTTAKEKESGKKIIKVDYKGGVKFHIKGSDFMKPSRIDIGSVSISGEELGEDGKGIDHLPKVKDKETYEELVFVMPEVPEDYVGKPPYKFIVTTPYDEKGSGLNAASVSSTEGEFEIYVEFTKGETKPKITKLTPNKGPSAGGNKVAIEGEDFRKHDPSREMYGELRVSVDGKEIPKKDISFISSKKLEIVMPQHKSGKVKIKVENPDGVVAEVEGTNDEYTYISSPKITGVVDPDNGDIPVRVISIDGGQKIKIQGSDFDKGAKVIFGPVLKKASENPELQGRRIFIEEGDKVVEYIYETGSGSEGTELEFIDSSNIEVKTPAGKLGPTSVIVINPDDAATEEYKLEYGIPDMTAPQDVRATLIKDEYIRINWREVKDEATKKDGKTVQYEVYVIEGGTREFVGTTGTTGFIFRDIEPNKTYKFLIRSVGKYGSSKPIEESMSNEVKTGAKAGPVDNDGKLGEKTKVDKIGNTANVVIGKDAFTQGSEYVIDMTRGPLSGSTEVVVSISAETVVNQKSKKIKMIGKDYSLDFNLSVFENSTLKSNVARGDAGVRFTVQPVNPSFDLKENNGETIIAAKYLLDAKVFVASSEENVESLNGTMNFALDYDSNMAESRRMKTINLVRYDAYGRRFENIGGNSNYGASTGNVKNLGTYTIIGSRR